MVRKVFRAGHSAVVALPREVMAQAGVAEGCEVTVAYDPEHGGILVRPVHRDVPGVDEAFARQVNGFIDRYRPMLEALAKHEPPDA